jgi:hypothetical protein
MKTRPILVIILTLIIGFVLGMLTSAQIRFHRLKPMRMYFTDDRFREGFYKVIQPDEKQKARIDQILDKYSKLNGDVQDKFRKELDTNVEAMKKELDQNLTRDQITRLKDLDDRRQEMMREAIKRHRQDTVRFHRRMRPGEQHSKSRGDFDDRGSPPPPSFPEPDTAPLPR